MIATYGWLVVISGFGGLISGIIVLLMTMYEVRVLQKELERKEREEFKQRRRRWYMNKHFKGYHPTDVQWPRLSLLLPRWNKRATFILMDGGEYVKTYRQAS